MIYEMNLRAACAGVIAVFVASSFGAVAHSAGRQLGAQQQL